MKKSKSKAVRAIEARIMDARAREQAALEHCRTVEAEIRGLEGALDAARKALERAPKTKMSKQKESVKQFRDETARLGKVDGQVPITVNETKTDGQ